MTLSDDVVQLELGLETDERLDLRDIRDAPRHVLESGLVGLIVRDVLDQRVAAGQALDSLGQLSNRDLAGVADVEHLAHGARLGGQRDERIHDVADVGEAA